MKADWDSNNISLNDILTLLKKIVNRAFNYNVKPIKPIENLIFPKCLSDYSDNNFRVLQKENIFCEGRLLKIAEDDKQYFLCRNRRCAERTERIDNNKYIMEDNYFFEYLKDKFKINSNDLFCNDRFIRSMGAFNRWNEIADRLFCGFPDDNGCGSTLIFDSAIKDRPGWQAYATTYWRCTNSSCSKNTLQVKLSHCAGCGKIIDSRTDKIACNRKDGKTFYVCTDCGYCCSQHEVSGICPKCGKNAGWTTNDPYLKWYVCETCGHKIAVPLRLRGCLGPKKSELIPGKQRNNVKVDMEYSGQKYDKDMFDDDIPF